LRKIAFQRHHLSRILELRRGLQVAAQRTGDEAAAIADPSAALQELAIALVSADDFDDNCRGAQLLAHLGYWYMLRGDDCGPVGDFLTCLAHTFERVTRADVVLDPAAGDFLVAFYGAFRESMRKWPSFAEDRFWVAQFCQLLSELSGEVADDRVRKAVDELSLVCDLRCDLLEETAVHIVDAIPTVLDMFQTDLYRTIAGRLLRVVVSHVKSLPATPEMCEKLTALVFLCCELTETVLSEFSDNPAMYYVEAIHCPPGSSLRQKALSLLKVPEIAECAIGVIEVCERSETTMRVLIDRLDAIRDAPPLTVGDADRLRTLVASFPVADDPNCPYSYLRWFLWSSSLFLFDDSEAEAMFAFLGDTDLLRPNAHGEFDDILFTAACAMFRALVERSYEFPGDFWRHLLENASHCQSGDLGASVRRAVQAGDPGAGPDLLVIFFDRLRGIYEADFGMGSDQIQPCSGAKLMPDSFSFPPGSAFWHWNIREGASVRPENAILPTPTVRFTFSTALDHEVLQI
jgi:hypothetical protein